MDRRSGEKIPGGVRDARRELDDGKTNEKGLNPGISKNYNVQDRGKAVGEMTSRVLRVTAMNYVA